MPNLRPIPGYPGFQASDDGRIWSNHKRGFMSPQIHKDKGYYKLNLRIAGKRYSRWVHNLVALTYLGERPEGMQIRHLNGDKLDNRPENLDWGTQSDNEQDKIRLGIRNVNTRPW